MFLLSPDVTEACWMEAPLDGGGFKWWLVWLSDDTLTTMWGENGQLTQSKIISTSHTEANLRAKIDEKLRKGYRNIGNYDVNRHLWNISTNVELPEFPPNARLHTYNDSTDFEIDLSGKGTLRERLVLKSVHGKFLGNESMHRLEHYINTIHVSYPTWQTLFATRDKAVEIVRELVNKRQDSGMVVTRGMEALSQFLPSDLVLSSPFTLVWDF